MKILATICSLFCIAFALEDETSGVSIKTNEQNLRSAIEKLMQYKDNLTEYNDGDGSVTAIVNEFADRLLENIDVFAKEKGLDPIPLNGFDDNFLVARVTLSNGSLSGVSTISRNGDVVAKFQYSANILDLEIPIKFEHITFEYKFYVLLVILGHSGKLTGNIDSVKVAVELSFDFNALEAKLNKFSMLDTGPRRPTSKYHVPCVGVLGKSDSHIQGWKHLFCDEYDF